LRGRRSSLPKPVDRRASVPGGRRRTCKAAANRHASLLESPLLLRERDALSGRRRLLAREEMGVGAGPRSVGYLPVAEAQIRRSRRYRHPAPHH